jgi:hypothetical protein
MRWEDERYVRLYTRDTVDWHFLSFEAQGLLALLMRKVDRAGILQLGKHGRKGVAAAIGHPGRNGAIDTALDELIADGCVAIKETKLLIPNFVAAQEAKTSDKARQQKARELARDMAAAEPEAVTPRDKTSQAVTGRHTASQPVTPNQPSRAVPSRAEPPVPKSGASKNEAPADARHVPLREKMKSVYLEERGAEFPWDAIAGKRLKELLEANPTLTVDQGAEVWRKALRNIGFPTVSTVDQFKTHLPHFLGKGPPTQAKPKDFSRGMVRADDVDKKSFEQTGVLDGF